jgi:hypothetical protein
MGEKTNQIEQHIREQRNELGQNISELQQKVKDTVDWRAQFEQRPMTMIGLAVGGGLLLSALVRSRSRHRNYNRASDGQKWTPEDRPAVKPYNPAVSNGQSNGASVDKASESLRDIRTALIGVAAAKIGDVIESVLPGFNNEYDKVKKGDRPFEPAHQL